MSTYIEGKGIEPQSFSCALWALMFSRGNPNGRDMMAEQAEGRERLHRSLFAEGNGEDRCFGTKELQRSYWCSDHLKSGNCKGLDGREGMLKKEVSWES